MELVMGFGCKHRYFIPVHVYFLAFFGRTFAEFPLFLCAFFHVQISVRPN